MRIRMSADSRCAREEHTGRRARGRVGFAIRPSSSPSLCLHQILLGDGGAEAVIVVDESADEFVHSLLDNLVHAAVLEPGAHRARVAPGRPLAPGSTLYVVGGGAE